MNATALLSNSSAPIPTLSPSLLPPADPSVASGGTSGNVTDVTAAMSDKPCGEALSSQTPAPVRLPGSLDALLYIVIVLMFYAFSIVVLMVKYIRREREEANLRNYYHEFVSRDKFRSAQYKNRQFMSRIFGRGGGKSKATAVAIEDEENSDVTESSRNSLKRNKGQAQTITRKGNTFSRLLVECDDDNHKNQREKESFTFLSAKNQFCRNGFFGKKFCNKQLCSKCVSESAPSIDWGDGKGAVESSAHCPGRGDLVEVTLHNSGDVTSFSFHPSQRPRHHDDADERGYSMERDNHTFLPIMECDSEKEIEDMDNVVISVKTGGNRGGGAGGGKREGGAGGGGGEAWADREAQAYLEEHALVSSCSLEVSELLANMPPLGGDGSVDMDTLDGLSNLDSEAESQSLLNYSSSLRGSDCRSFLHSSNSLRKSPRKIPRLNSSDSTHSQLRYSPKVPAPNDSSSNKGDMFAEDRARELSDVLSERTSLLSCTLSIAEADDEDAHTNHSSSKHFVPNGFTHSNNSNGKIKPDFKNNGRHDLKSNGKSLLNSLSKSISSEEEDVMKLLNGITLLTDDSGVFRNLKYFLRSFSRNDEEKDIAGTQDKLNTMPKETYFGPDSPKSVLGDSGTCDLPPANASSFKSSPRLQNDLDSIHDEPVRCESSEKDYGNRWGYANDEEDLFSDRSSSIGERSSSFGDYCMGQATDSQTIDLSKPLVRRQLDTDTKAGLSRAIIGLNDPWSDELPIHKPNPMLAGYGPARKETKV